MKSDNQWMLALSLMAGASLLGTVNSRAARLEVKEATEMMSSYEGQQKASAEAREKDPAWKPACSEVGVIEVGQGKGALKNFCLNTDGNILACFVANEAKASKSKPAPVSGLQVFSPKGELLKTLPLDIKPCAVCVSKDGVIYVAGDGRVLKLDQAGKVLASADSPVAKEKIVISKETEEMVNEQAKQTKQTPAAAMEGMRKSLENRRADITGLAVTDEDVFMACPSPSDFTFRVYRFDRALANSKQVVEKLRGCCGQMDIQAHDGKLWIPHNARHMVECCDRDGNRVSKFGKSGKVKAGDFGGCCEPKNMRVLPNGEILAAESGPPTCIKRFSADGKFLGVVAVVKGAKGDCVRVTVEASADGSRYYMLDTTRNAIRIFGAKS